MREIASSPDDTRVIDLFGAFRLGKRGRYVGCVRAILHLGVWTAAALALFWVTPPAGILAGLAIGAAAGVTGLFRLVQRLQDSELAQGRR
jgi:hypothetical protein